MRNIFTIIIAILTLVSCTKEETLQDKIIGKWLPEGTYYITYIDDVLFDQGESNDGDFILEFYSDGTGSMQGYLNEDDWYDTRWSIRNGQLYLTYANDIDIFDIIFTDSDKMALRTKTEWFDGGHKALDIMTLNFKRSQ